MRKLDYREDIDALRGLSVALVVIFHAFPSILPGGFIGVDVFFVISGYLITSIMLLSVQSGSFSMLEFYARRIRRIFPAMLFVLFTALVFGWLVLFPDEYSQLGGHVKYASIFFLNFDLIGELGYFDVESIYKPLVHFWTLSIEEQYYLLWPVLLLVCLKISDKPAVFFLVVLAASFGANLYFVNDYPEEVFFHTGSRLWQLAVGSLLAAITLNRKLAERKYLFIGGAVAIVYGALIIDGNDPYPGYMAIIPTAGAMLTILSNARFPTYFGFSWLGLISYSLYLWHWVFISFGHIYLGRAPSTVGMIALIGVSMAAAYLTYRYVEPLRYRKRVVTGLVLSAIAVGLLGLYVESRDGLPERASVDYYNEAGYQFARTLASDEACHNLVEEILGEERLFYYCRAENLAASRLIAVVGDSHAHAWFPGLAHTARKHGYGTLLLASSGCPSLPGFEWGQNQKQREQCQSATRQMMRVLQQDVRIEKIAFTTRGPVKIHGEVEGPFTVESVEESLKREVDGSRLTYETYFSGFRKLIEYFENLSHVSSVYYLLENPELDFLPKEVIPRPFDFFAISTNRNFVDRGLYLLRMARYREGVNELNSPKLVVLDPINVLCDSRKCHSFINGNFAYADDDHFSVYGSELISDYFEDQMFKGQHSE